MYAVLEGKNKNARENGAHHEPSEVNFMHHVEDKQ